MNIVDEEPGAWYLLEDEAGTLYLNAFCSHSAVDYYFLMALDEKELDQFRRQGRDYLGKLAYAIHYSAPGVRGSKSPYKSRHLNPTHGSALDEAISRWHGRE